MTAYRAFVLMTALPPTTGHLDLIRFASHLADHVTVVLNTQPHEPYSRERAEALRSAVHSIRGDVRVYQIHRTIQQEPNGENDTAFWDMWRDFLIGHCALEPGDLLVASEMYGLRLAKEVGAKFVPYDIAREINDAKATRVRNNVIGNFDIILPEFQKYLRPTVTVFGADSTGKTTLSKDLARTLGGHWVPEWARPYLETVGPDLTPDAMRTIAAGQQARQQTCDDKTGKPFIVQDTDLFTTLGLWRQFRNNGTLTLDEDDERTLTTAAAKLTSDLYLVTKSNIEFEPDPLRYGGDQRETTDQYWLDLCAKFNLNYLVLDSADHDERLAQATEACWNLSREKVAPLYYTREGSEYR
ncbi:AAA family ATPase [Aeromicrobium sp. 179-A 4D2 NHS]|uniref:AAA family ATPase n=1 Tax=Aeromicrobium sp. 179-A 4D2 NHS TaxID=3142375 RepID=UPI0039A1DACB